MRKLLIIIVIIGMFVLPATIGCGQVGTQASSDDWKMTLNHNVIWIGEQLEINVTGEPDAWVQVLMTSADGNITYSWDAITDANGTVWFRFADFYTEYAGRYTMQLRVENNITPLITEYVDINYDDVLYLFILFEKLEAYLEMDLKEYDARFDGSLPDAMSVLEWEVIKAKLMANKCFAMWIFTVLALALPYVWLIWLKWDSIALEWEKKRKAVGLPKSRFRNWFKLHNPRHEQIGHRVQTRTPTFDDGRTLEEKNVQRTRLLRKHKQFDFEVVDLMQDKDKRSTVTIVKDYFNMPVVDADIVRTKKENKEIKQYNKKAKKIKKQIDKMKKELKDTRKEFNDALDLYKDIKRRTGDV